MKLKMTHVYLDPTDAKRLKRLAETMSRAETRRVTASELLRKAVREFLARQEG